MLKKIYLGIFFCLIFTSVTFADETVTIDIGSDRIVVSGSIVNLSAEFGGTCSNIDLATIYWMEQNDKGDWISLQNGGRENIYYSFTATTAKQIKAQIRCPQGNGPLFTSEIIGEDIITITVSSPPDSDPVVFAGDNNTYSPGDMVYLAGSITDTSCTIFDYQWEQLSGPTIEIVESGKTGISSSSFTGANFVFPDTTEELKFQLSITPQSCIHAGNTYLGTVIYTKTIPRRGGSGGRSWSSRMTDEANILFIDTESISKISLNLQLSQKENYPILYFFWNNIGGNGQVHYSLEYSTGAKFETYETFETLESYYNFINTSLDKTSLVHFFRIKAGYTGKYSSYSNILTYYSEDYLILSCCNKDRDYPTFSDIFLGADFLIEDYYSPLCKRCYTHR